uniref:condensation domain-containing protein n=1 Tax=Pelomonas sp. BJYL3 TaxID=2976697 RepID=UPI0022B4C664
PQVVNNYGPTECADVVAWQALSPEHGVDEVVPLGRAVRNTQLYVLDERQQLLPLGVVGEICVAGVGVGRGYLHQPQLTEERFVADPFSEEAGARMYKTGDLGRWLPDGTLEYLGRNDFQVKIRGFRIELGEIEAKLAALGAEEAGDVVVLAREDQPGDKRLVAYYTGTASAEQLRAQAEATLPSYMVPAACVQLASLPLNPNGKLDRKALPAPDEQAWSRRAYEAPQGEVEATLAAIWAELLQIERVGRHDNFFELGGHSLMAVSLIERMRRAGLGADVRTLFNAPTVAELAAATGQGSTQVVVPPNLIPEGATAITPQMLTLVQLDQSAIDRIVAGVEGGAANVQDIYPLTAAQEGILFHHRMDSGSDAYVEASLLACNSRERLDAFLLALQQLVDRHDILRTGIAWDGLDEPVQVVRRRATLPVTQLELDPAAGEVARQLEELLDPRSTRIDASQAPMLRVAVAHDAENGRWLLRLLCHHLVMDHTTQDLLIKEAELLQRGRPDLLLPPVPFRDFVAAARLGVSEEEHRDFFTRMLGDIEEPTAPFDLLDVLGDGQDVSEARVPLPDEMAQATREAARRMGVGVASVMHLAWALVLAKLSGRESPVFGTVLFGRMQGGAHADRVLGMFINTLPVRIDVDASAVSHGLRRVHALLSGLLRHEHASLALAQRCSGVSHGMPLFSSLLNYRYTSIDEEEADADLAELDDGMQVLHGEERTNYPLVLSVDDLGSGFSLTAQVRQPVDPFKVCDFMKAALASLLHALLKAPSTPLRQVDVLPAAERRQLLNDWNVVPAQAPLTQTLHELFETQVRQRSQAVALVDGEQTLSYGELNAEANRLARHLVGLGVKPEDGVALCLARGAQMVVALLAVLKAGAAYVPLDPAYASERLGATLADSAPVVVLVDAAGREALGEHL